MKPIVYEVKRTLTSKFVIVMIIAIVGLSALLSYESAVTYHSSPLAARTPSINYGYYVSNDNLTIVTFSHDPYGTPSNEVNVYASYQSNLYQGASNQNGFANITMPIQTNITNTVTLNYTYRLFGNTISSPSIELKIAPGDAYSGYSIYPGLINEKNNSRFGFMVMYVGANGSSSPDVSVHLGTYYAKETSSEIVSNSSYVINASGFTARTFFPVVGNNFINESFAAALVSSNGTILQPTTVIPSVVGKLAIYIPITQKTLQNLVFQATGPILGFLIPILAVFASYLTYGKDRTTGVLESVLKRPVTRGGVITSRFLANSVSIIIAVVISMFVGDLVIHHYFSMYLSTSFLLYLIWTYSIEGLAFLSLVYLFSHLVKSQGALLGAAIAAFVVLDLFWSIIPAAILAALSIPSTSSTYVMANVAFNYASPAGYSTLVQLLFTKKLGFLATHTINPAAYGVTTPILIITGIIWVIVPFVAAYFLAKTRD